ncbi:replication stress response regulator SDE2 [Neltuma alba]|uniref:replication stress response regulator SDE2 n=1 Tax=Neltuma alba TaxID=207710 RepID=UPI0010A30659|nr:replication stress response regulator SDE2 [Prosopis alba]
MEDHIVTTKAYNLFVKLLDGKTLALKFPSPILYANSIKDRVFEVTRIPIQHQRLVTGVRDLNGNESVISCSPEGGDVFPTVHLLLRLAGGKGGFGSLLRGAATKAGQKKTNNFEACRDMSGRRLRHVNAEKRLEEWKAEEAERKLEKIAEEFLKKQAKKGKKGVGDGEAHKYVAKYREESERCTAEVAESVKEALMSINGKRKVPDFGKGRADAKKMKIWMGKRKLNESDSDDSDDDGNDDEEENEKSTVLNNENDSESNKAEGSSGSVTGGKRDGESSVAGSSGSCSEEEKETVVEGKIDSSGSLNIESLQNITANLVEPVICDKMATGVTMPVLEPPALVIDAAEDGRLDSSEADRLDSAAAQATNLISSEHVVDSNKSNDIGTDGLHEHKASSHEETHTSASAQEIEEPLSFDSFNSAAELEVLGLERLKSELQAHGLKCGGTLQERAARLFLLKSTPLDKLPKKLLAKK